MGSEGFFKGLPQQVGRFFWIQDPLKGIRTGSFKFLLKVRDTLVLPAYKGSTLRHGFGYAFKQVVCALRNQDCPACLLKEEFLYSYVFETPPPADTHILRKYKAAPHPLIIKTSSVSQGNLPDRSGKVAILPFPNEVDYTL